MSIKFEKYAERLNSELHSEGFSTYFFARFVVIWTLVSRIPLSKKWWPKTVPAGNRSLSLIPLAGGILGFLTGALIASVNILGMVQTASVWIGAMFYALIGWSLHLDGWGDLWDGIGSGRSGEELRSVMKDSRLGAYGAIGLILAFGLWTSLLISLSPAQQLAACIISASAGRFSSCVTAFYGSYPWNSGMGKGWVDTFTGYDLFTAGICVLIFMPFAPIRWFFSVLFACIVGYWLACWMNKRLGGVNGDVLGAGAVASELFALMVFNL